MADTCFSSKSHLERGDNSNCELLIGSQRVHDLSTQPSTNQIRNSHKINVQKTACRDINRTWEILIVLEPDVKMINQLSKINFDG